MGIRRSLLAVSGAMLMLSILVGSCSAGTSTTSSAGGDVTTSNTGGDVTTTTGIDAPASGSEGHGDLAADLASPAQEVLDAVYSSVVNISVSGTVRGQTGQGIGSGIVYTSDGYIMTNEHVVTLDGNLISGQSIMVTFSSGEKVPATLVGTDQTRDLAALKVDKTGLDPVTFGRTSEVQLAEWAIVIGSPLDFRNSVNLGIVSGLDRTLDFGAGQVFTGLMQIDAAVSPGNSGGGCFDAQGHFIGMPEIYLPPGQTGAVDISFAIPADVVASVAKTLTGK